MIRFLKGLNEKFNSSKSQIMMMNLIPNIEEVFSLVIQHERELSLASSSDSTDSAAFLLHV